MQNIDAETIREIYETVYNNVMSEIKEGLSQMKPQLVQMITNEVIEKQTNLYLSKIDGLEKDIKQLKKDIKRKNIHEKSNSEPVLHSGTTTLKADYESENRLKQDAPKVNVSGLYGGFRYNGWIYYANKEMAEFLYKVRTDGTCNTQITDYSVKLFDCKVINGYFEFKDANFVPKKIKVD